MTNGAGAPEPLGVTLRDGGVNVAVYSARARTIEFCLFDATGETEVSRVALSARAGDVHYGFVPGVGAGARYGLRAHGDFAPERGERFDPSKLLIDPYAFALDRACLLHDSMFEVGADSGSVAPKGVVDVFAPERPPAHARTPWADTILYELNLRAFTRLHPDIPEAARGTFAGLAHPAAIGHLARLGVTSVEIMPAHAFVDERQLHARGLTNAWGYNPIALGAPDPRLAPGGWREVRMASDALHEAGLEAILDVVLNHSGECDEFGPTLSMRGLDNSAYYRLAPHDPAQYVNDMGCGNCLALYREPMLGLAIESLRRWVTLGGFDGFRFDLATAIGRRETGFDPAAPLFAAIDSDPILGAAKLIAEPWDIGPGGYQLGAFPARWSEWNDRYRDAARRFWRGDRGVRGEIATRIAGSRDIFPHAGAPTTSVNFITAHDGFTLADLVAYSSKHNEANGEDNRDGANENYSWNEGVEGPSDDPAVRAARARDMRNLLVFLLISRGAPMLSMGAELGHSQHGNNNAYAQDNASAWLDWAKADMALVAFTTKLIAIRRQRPALSRDAYLEGAPFDASGLPDVEWRDAEGPLRSAEQWQEPEGRNLVVVFASPGAGDDDADRVAIVLNRAHEAASVVLPATREGFVWRVLLDTDAQNLSERDLAPGERLAASARASLIVAEIPTLQRRIRPADDESLDKLAAAAGIADEWWDVEGKRTRVGHDTKTALLAAMRLPAASQTEARASLARLVEERERRALPFYLVARAGEQAAVALRSDPSAPLSALDATIQCEDGTTIAFKCANETRRLTLSDGRPIDERRIALPPLPAGRHRLLAGGAECAITIAPAKAYFPASARRAFGFSAQLYALRRQGDQGVGDFSTLGRLGAAAAGAGALALGLNPLHMLFAQDRERASPYHPSDRRFLDPIHIDALDGVSLPSDADFLERALERGREIAALAAAPNIDYPRVWRLKGALLEARYAAFNKARAAQPADALFADFDKFVAEGGDPLRRFACFEAIAYERPREDWRLWPAELRDAEPAALARTAERLKDRVGLALFLQWLADRQLAGAAQRARAAGLEIGLYRDLAVGAASDGAEAWSRAAELAVGASIGAPPDPFSPEGQNWRLPPPDPLACAREGWRGLAEVYGANMRHAGALRIDHAMGLMRLFLIPDGAKPAEGAYVAYPRDDLFGLIKLESQRRRCVIVGEDLGTVPEGFPEALAQANMLGTRVLWFERKGAEFLPPARYPPLAVACVSTHDLPTLAGWWSGADLAERKALGFSSLEEDTRQSAARRADKQALIRALAAAGLATGAPDLDAPLTDALAGAVHALVARTPSLLALAQTDDLSGETIATNLPGTDHERPNWRRRLPLDVDSLFGCARARAVLAALAAERPGADPAKAHPGGAKPRLL